jgi:selenocysteine-specific elongation factor
MSTSSPKIYFTVATAGHVDHGKTSVLRALTGMDPDRLKEEKQRQMTIDLGFAHLAVAGTGTSEYTVGFIDVPGHGKFLKNMLAGVGGIEMALLVVAADEGPMPQTVAHVKILSLLGVKKILLILTKTDLASEVEQADAIERVDSLLQQFELEKIDTVKVSCLDNRGIDELKKKLGAALSTFHHHSAENGVDATPVYLPIDRVFSKSGYGLVVTGTLVRGRVGVGDNLFVEPGGLKARVRGLETFGCTLQSATAGQRLAINLTFKEHVSLERGQTILGDDLQSSKTLIVKFTRTKDEHDKSLDKSLLDQQIRLYHGTAECHGEIRWVQCAGDDLIGQINLDDPLIAEPRDRFILRYGDDGISGGEIVCTARPRWLTRPKLIDLCSALVAREDDKAISLFLDACPQRTVRTAALDAILSRTARSKLISNLVDKGEVVKLAEYICTRESIDALAAKVRTQLSQAPNAAESDADESKQFSLETVRSKVLPGVDRAAFQALVKILSERGVIERSGDKLLLPEAKNEAKATPGNNELANQLREILLQHFCLELQELATQTGRNLKEVTAAINQLSKEFKATIVNYEFAGATEKLNEAHKILVTIWQTKKDISPADFRDAIGSTRKYAMALLAHFDDTGVTRRLNNTRVLLKNPKSD